MRANCEAVETWVLASVEAGAGLEVDFDDGLAVDGGGLDVLDIVDEVW